MGTEVTNLSAYGVWLLAGDRELLMSYEAFTWFRDAPIGKILHVKEPAPGHFYWPQLDGDLGVESIVKARGHPSCAGEPRGAGP